MTNKVLLPGLALALALGACDDEPVQVETPGTIVEVAVEAGSFSTLLGALEQAGLAATFEGDGPYTVFAPTDAAFSAVPEAALDDLVSDRERLTAVLTYHVVAGRVDSGAALESGALTTLNGQKLSVTQDADGTVRVDGVPVARADIEASNGIIHAVSGVLFPSEVDVVAAAQADSRFRTLVQAVVAAELAGTLSGEGPFTVFAPTDEAFARLPDGTVEALLDDPEALRDVLTFHVVSGRLLSPEVLEAGTLTTLQGGTLDVNVEADGTVTVGGAALLEADVQTTNGVIHVIDGVLLPGS